MQDEDKTMPQEQSTEAPVGAEAATRPDVGTLLAAALTDVQIDDCAAAVAHQMPQPGHYLMSVPMLRELIRSAVSRVAIEATEPADEPDRDDGPADSTRINWMEAQAALNLYEWVNVVPGAGSVFELADDHGTVVGRGPELRAAIDDAMGRRPL